jgi:sialate O-acetylesterase
MISVEEARRAGVAGTRPAPWEQERAMNRSRARPKTVAAIAIVVALSPLGTTIEGQDDPADEQMPGATTAVHPALAIELGAPFRDHAILQREMPVPVWGWSRPGTKVTVEFAGQKVTAEAGQDGKWMARLKPLKASAEPAEMVISASDGKKVTLKDVLVGEVWVASGQSNMQWKPVKCDVGKLLARIAASVKDGKEKQPVIREFEVSSVYSALHPVEHAAGAWKDGNFPEYSAIAFAFAYEIYRELGIPIGILNCSFSMTSIRAWTPRCGFKDGQDEQTQAIYQSLLETDPSTPAHKAAWEKFYRDIEDTVAANAELVKRGKPAVAISTKTPGNMEGNRDATWMFNGRMNPVVPYAIRGAIWNQCYSSMFEGVHYYHRMQALVRGWREVWGQGDFPVYYHQLYAPGANDGLTLNDMGEMRLGFWLARDIPDVGMASQIDITGGIHYYNKALPGKRLALHALKNQYGKKIVADGPMFKAYEVKGDKLVVTLDFAEGGLLVGQKVVLAEPADSPVVLTNAEGKVTLFYLADKDRVWHRAKLKIAGEKLELAAAGLKEPRGVAYACNGVGALPNVYNKAMLPLSPFICYDHKLVTSKALSADGQAWPDDPIKVEGVKIDPSTVGKRNEYQKMPLVGQQFRDNAVFQADMPVVFWGSAVHDWGYEAKGKAEINFSFAGIEKTIPVTPGMKEWQVIVPPMKASAEPKTLKVTFTIDGELAHERVCTNLVVGDVWYVAAPPMAAVSDPGAPASGLVRVMKRNAQRDRSSRPSRFSVSVSTRPSGTGAAAWENAKGGLAAILGQRIAAKSGKPVGIIFMQSAGGKDVSEPELKHWIDAPSLQLAPSLADDYRQLAGLEPGTDYYAAFARSYVAAWKKYWSEYVPKLIAEKQVPDGVAWGTYPSFGGKITTEAAQSYNVLTCPFTPGSVKGIVFLAGEAMFRQDQGENFAEQLTVLANSWKAKFALRQDSGQACPDPVFCYTVPSQALAPKISKPVKIDGSSVPVELGRWLWADPKDKDAVAAAGAQVLGIVDRVVNEAYK